MLNPNLAAAWFLSAYLRLWRGETDQAIERFAHSMRLSPLDPEMYRMEAGTAMAHLLAGRFDSASLWGEKAYRDLPSFLLAVGILAASHGNAGRMDRAEAAIGQMRKLDPALRLSNLKGWVPFLRSEDFDLFAGGLRKAGLPE